MRGLIQEFMVEVFGPVSTDLRKICLQKKLIVLDGQMQVLMKRAFRHLKHGIPCLRSSLAV